MLNVQWGTQDKEVNFKGERLRSWKTSQQNHELNPKRRGKYHQVDREGKGFADVCVCVSSQTMQELQMEIQVIQYF